MLSSFNSSVPGVFGNQQNQNLDVIKRMLLSALQPTESDALRIQSVKAIGAFILLHDKQPVIQQHFQDVLLPLMQVSNNSSLLHNIPHQYIENLIVFTNLNE